MASCSVKRVRLLLPVFVLGVAIVAGCVTRPPAGGVSPVTPTGTVGRLEQAQSLMQAGDVAAAWRVVKEITIADLPRERRLDGAEIKAEIALANHRPRAALQALAAVSTPSTAKARARLLALKARALFANGQSARGLELMVEHGRSLTDPAAIRANNELTWMLISSASPLPSAAGLSRMAQGWIALARIERTAWEEPRKFAQRIADWSAAWPAHPANAGLLAQIRAEEQAQLRYPAKIALLLPLSGAYAEQARAVQAGLLAAYYRSAVPRPTIAIYDTGGTAEGARAALTKARAGAADFVVGPLTPAGVNAIVAMRPAIPVLALNYLNAGIKAPPRFFQFGLSPAQQARSVAERAVSQGLTRAVVLVPANDWGRSIADAFTRQLTALGGRVLASAEFQPGGVHFAVPLSLLFGLDASLARKQAIASTVGRPLGFTPRRRQDIEFVFFAAPFTTARLLVPQIDYYHGMGLPVYSIANVYQIGASPDDLDGVHFPIMPWFIASGGPIASLRNELSSLYSSAWRNYARLFALGYDAWRLIPMLDNETRPLARPVRGVTGRLSLGLNRVIVRRADWAHYMDGEARPAVSQRSP